MKLATTTTTLRVMTYNLLYGSHEREGDALIFHPERAEAARAVILAEAPDVLGLTEAVYGGHRGRKIRQDFCKLYGLPHWYTEGDTGDWANCLLSKYPITHAERVALGASGTASGISTSALRATLDCGGRPVHVDLVHPSPHVSEAARVEAFAPLLTSLRERHIMMGDFNALSDEDPYDHETLVAQLRPYVSNPEALAARMLDRALLAKTRGHGLRDALPVEARTHTLPTHLSRPHATQGGLLRIDYVLVTDDLRVRSGKVVQSEDADRASDHYPVVVDLEF